MTLLTEHTSTPGTPEPQPKRGGRGLAITALVVAIVSLLLCWVPIVNNLVFFLGLIGLVLAVPAFLRARKGKSAGKGMALAAILLSVLSLVGVLASQAYYGSVLDGVSDAIEDAADGEVAKSEDDKAAEADALALGAVAQVGREYEVAVTDVNLDATKALLKVNEFNSKPKGQYVLVTLDVTYVGDKEGDPWLDLTTKLAGSDSRNYDSSTCDAVVARPSMDVPTLTNGGTATYDVCFDVPAAAVEDPTVFIEESISFDDTRSYWSVS